MIHETFSQITAGNDQGHQRTSEKTQYEITAVIDSVAVDSQTPAETGIFNLWPTYMISTDL